MGINLKNIQPHKVSRQLSGYMTYVYGPGGSGKTTLGSQMPNPLILAFEKGYNALPGVMAQDITSWGEMKQVLRQLDDPEVKEMFSSIVVDTVDIASQLCERYVCSQLGIENIGDGGWAVNGWAKVKKEWETTFRTLAMKGYAILFISHSKEKKFQRKDGTEYDGIVPSCSKAYNEIIRNMCDLQGFIHVDNNDRKMVLRWRDETIECKSRFALIEPVIPFSYDSLVKALNDAIDAESKLNNGKFVTTEEISYSEPTIYDFDKIIAEFNSIVETLSKEANFGEYWAPRITEIIERYLGKGKKVNECSRDQAELLSLVVDELKDLIPNTNA